MPPGKPPRKALTPYWISDLWICANTLRATSPSVLVPFIAPSIASTRPDWIVLAIPWYKLFTRSSSCCKRKAFSNWSLFCWFISLSNSRAFLSNSLSFSWIWASLVPKLSDSFKKRFLSVTDLVIPLYCSSLNFSKSKFFLLAFSVCINASICSLILSFTFLFLDLSLFSINACISGLSLVSASLNKLLLDKPVTLPPPSPPPNNFATFAATSVKNLVISLWSSLVPSAKSCNAFTPSSPTNCSISCITKLNAACLPCDLSINFIYSAWGVPARPSASVAAPTSKEKKLTAFPNSSILSLAVVSCWRTAVATRPPAKPPICPPIFVPKNPPAKPAAPPNGPCPNNNGNAPLTKPLCKAPPPITPSLKLPKNPWLIPGNIFCFFLIWLLFIFSSFCLAIARFWFFIASVRMS